MNAGKLNKRLTFVAPIQSLNEFNENVPTYTEVVTVWGSIKPLTGRQLELAQANTATAISTHEIRVRFRPTINYSLRILYDQSEVSQSTLTASELAALNAGDYAAMTTYPSTPVKTYTINAIVDTLEQHRELVITATEVTI